MTTTSAKGEDRRIQRTRQLLRQASIEVMQEKGFKGTSIQDITERANVNRGTFYAYFPDKYALLEAIIREEFQHSVADKLPPLDRWDQQALQLLVQIVLEDFKNVYRHCHPLNIIDPLIVQVVQEELATLLLTWLQLKRGAEGQPPVPLEMMARSMSWVIVGEALQWSRGTNGRSLEQEACDIVRVMLEGVAHLAPTVSPE